MMNYVVDEWIALLYLLLHLCKLDLQLLILFLPLLRVDIQLKDLFQLACHALLRYAVFVTATVP